MCVAEGPLSRTIVHVPVRGESRGETSNFLRVSYMILVNGVHPKIRAPGSLRIISSGRQSPESLTVPSTATWRCCVQRSRKPEKKSGRSEIPDVDGKQPGHCCCCISLSGQWKGPKMREFDGKTDGNGKSQTAIQDDRTQRRKMAHAGEKRTESHRGSGKHAENGRSVRLDGCG
jgi:hypothetical protein